MPEWVDGQELEMERAPEGARFVSELTTLPLVSKNRIPSLFGS